MGRHGTHSEVTQPLRLGRATRSRRYATPGTVLIAAVAAGAVLPAVQTLDTTHTADAEAPVTGETASAALDLAAQQASTAGGPSVSTLPIAAVSPITMPAAAASSSSAGSDTEAASSAGDSADVTALMRSMALQRENGPLEFGRPYEAGNEDTLDGQIARALGLMGLPQRLAPGIKQIIMRESTGNPNAINNWDSNAANGTPSKGLMQLIDTTFRNAVLPSLADRGIYDPVANITAGVRTMIANHGMDALMDGGLQNSSGSYVGYGGSALPTDGLGRA